MIFQGLDAEAYDREYGDVNLLRRVWRYFATRPLRVAVILASVMAVSAIQAAVPILIARGVGTLSAGATSTTASSGGAAGGGLTLLGVALTPGQTAAALIAAVFAASAAIWGLNYVRRRETTRAIADVVLALRRDAFEAAVRHDLSFYDTFASGRIVSRITSDTQDFGQTVALVADLAGQVVQIGLLTIVLFGISPRMTALLIMWAPVVFGIALGFRAVARRTTRQGFRATADVNAKIFETVAGISIAKNFRREATVYDEFSAVNQRAYGINLRRGFVLATVFPALNILIGGGVGVLMYAGALSVVQGAIAAGAWFLFLQSIDAFWFPLMNLSAFWSQFQAGLAAIERVFALVDAVPAVVQRAADPVDRVAGDIRFEHVGFRYSESAGAVLPEFSLHIRPGESVALVGHTGSGKSSIAKLVARFYEYQSGRILIDDRDIRTLDLSDYRRHLGIVPQVPFLFSGTVADNIRYARPSATDAEIEALAHRIGGGEWLRALPGGLATDVGERGGQLSLGQRQLVALMRVLLQQPAIFILDEATASVDPFTESQIQEALELILAHTTSIIIAHRLSTVRAADRILVLREGRIIEEGDHAALMRAGGHYADLYDTYFRHQSLDYRVTADG